MNTDTSLSFPLPVLDRSGPVHECVIRDNRQVRKTLKATEAVEYRELPLWIERTFGTTCQGQIHPARVFGILLRLDELNPTNIGNLINPPRIAMNLKPYSMAWCTRVNMWCRRVSLAMRRHESYTGTDHMRSMLPEDVLPVSKQERINIQRFRRLSTQADYWSYVDWVRRKYDRLEKQRIKRELREALKAVSQ